MTDQRDPLAEAIVGAAAREQARAQPTAMQVTVSTGRIIGVVAPANLTESELLELVGYLGARYLPQLREETGPQRSGLVVVGKNGSG